jgi:hypothetical protein
LPAAQPAEQWTPLEAEIVALLRSSGVVLNPETSLQREKIVGTLQQLVAAYKAANEQARLDDQLIKQLAAKLATKL